MATGAESENGPESKQGASVEVGGGRVRFNIELNPWETTIVSWKKLLKKANISVADVPDPSAPGPSFEAPGHAVAEPPTPPVSNRVDFVLCMWNLQGSSDDDDYDTDDSFIDDIELEESPSMTNLENAFGELAKIVAQLRPPSTHPQDPVNQSHSGKKRLPSEIKLELAKVARIAASCYERIPKEVIDRLMSILGHLMQITTLKRNLRAMANAGLSAKQEKYDKIQKMKQEVAEMVKSRDAGKKHKHSFNNVLENKICKLYDLYVESLEEDSCRPVEKLYEELALLWPGGFMNTNRIKRAIYRAKERNGIRSFRKLTSKIARSSVTSNSPNPGKMKEVDHQQQPRPYVGTKPSSLQPKKKAKRMPNAEVAEAIIRLEKLVISQGTNLISC
ncbi:hypothetical protein SASPL_131301 [Salvia splendens]|uniref:Ubinuclein n=1 Tax=Salvia splendens TaxID=180675 RepID=A0A8X8ZKR2_SALSN|nr:ubinuclein-1-like [Salvia splendens]KAG6408296.1 hypothetical protein SASPL_131301 [Salvia splendens]